ncbi:MAG: UDP-N-acetylglucosamine--N-acetylmuramyl-(pentapeptide) pyrophosphoryl-undecaprenol N-acetylglucosamine transferase, partial [Alphaproteobacteria bacterium MarineAlpha4_Bin2]
QIGKRGFHDLRDVSNRPINENWRERRRDGLLELFESFQPNFLITEAFPFGRRQMRFELIPFLEHATSQKSPPKIFCSVRDILKSNRKAGRAKETSNLIKKYYDGVLVHGDPNFVKFEETFPETQDFKEKIVYTGIVADRYEYSLKKRRREILVSAGGGAVGLQLFETALKARVLSKFSGATWRLLFGPNIGETDYLRFQAQASDRVIIERYRSDFRELLTQCAVSVSQAGYNSTADILMAATPAVLVPFDIDDEDEQPRRAAKLAERGYAETIPSGKLTPVSLAAAVDKAGKAKPFTASKIDLDGARRTAEFFIKQT